MADVFISYARSTVDCAEALARVVEAEGHSVWYDARLPAHRAYADVIQEQIDAARAVLIIWSHEAVRSQWVRSEADRARLKGTLIQLRIEDCALPMPFDQIECPLVQQWTGDPSAPTLAPVLRSLVDLLNGTDARDAPAPQRMQWQRPEEAQLLFDNASRALQSGRPAEHAQAIALLIEATTIAPEDSQAWGLLAVLFAARRLEVPPRERPALVARARSAIKTALDLDPEEMRARCAEVILVTPYRNWKSKEDGARRLLDEVPDQPIALFSLATVLGHVGRWEEAAEVATRISRKRFLLPAVEQFTVQALWSAGNIVQAELAGERAARRFPSHPGLWEARVALLMHSGRIGDAVSAIGNEPARPPDYPAAKLDVLHRTALALGGSGDERDAVRKNLEVVGNSIADPLSAVIEPLMTAQRCAALGAVDECFALLQGYYFGEGEWAGLAPPGGDEDRSTSPLFMPPMAALWTDERFERLTARIGLADYWSKAGVAPDHKRS